MEKGKIEDLINKGSTKCDGIQIHWRGGDEFRIQHNPRIYYSSCFIIGFDPYRIQRILFKKRFQESYSLFVSLDNFEDPYKDAGINNILDTSLISIRRIKADRETQEHILELELKGLEWETVKAKV